MKPFVKETSGIVYLPGPNCDTDQIVPARFLKESRDQQDGYGNFLFHDIRRNKDGIEDPRFPLNRPAAKSATFLLVDENFGCGSSREGAVYALVDGGIRAVIAPSFGDIFFNNALKNGLLPIKLPDDICQALARHLDAEGGTGQPAIINLETAKITLPAGLGTHEILIDDFARECILHGLDEIQKTFLHLNEIKSFEKKRLAQNPWFAR